MVGYVKIGYQTVVVQKKGNKKLKSNNPKGESKDIKQERVIRVVIYNDLMVRYIRIAIIFFSQLNIEGIK